MSTSPVSCVSEYLINGSISNSELMVLCGNQIVLFPYNFSLLMDVLLHSSSCQNFVCTSEARSLFVLMKSILNSTEKRPKL